LLGKQCLYLRARVGLKPLNFKWPQLKETAFKVLS
jgi:hypothetical protein